jgi:CBS-domain-containing membrane protein
MTTPVIGVTADATIEEAAKLMMDRGFTTLPVFNEPSRLVGLLTEADLGRARFATAEPTPEDGAIVGLRPRLVRQIMHAPVLAAPADAELGDLATAMVESRMRCVPVVEDGHVVGMVSWRDLLACLAQGWYVPPLDARTDQPPRSSRAQDRVHQFPVGGRARVRTTRARPSVSSPMP